MKWNHALKDYNLYLRIERGLSLNSLDSYSRDVKKLISFLELNELPISPLEIDSDTIQKFIYDASKSLSAGSQARLISGLRSFFDYLIFEEYRKTNPTDLIESPKLGRKLPDTLSTIGPPLLPGLIVASICNIEVLF